MTTDNVFLGNAPEVSKIATVTIVQANAESPYALQVGSKSVEVDGSSDPADIASRLAAAWTASTFAETGGITAVAAGNVITLTGLEPGVDYRVTATRDPVIKVVTTQPGSAAVNQRTRITLPEGTSGGTFPISLTYESGTTQTTTDLAWNASDATIESALVALAGVSAGDANVSGPAGGPWIIEFANNLAGQEVLVEVNTDALQGIATVTFAKVQEAGRDVKEIQYFGSNAVSISTGNPITFTYGGQSATTEGTLSEAGIQAALDELFGAGETIASLMQNGFAAICTVLWTDGLPRDLLRVSGGGFWPTVGRLVAGGGTSKDQVALFKSSGTANYTITVNGETTGSVDSSGPTNEIVDDIRTGLNALTSVAYADFNLAALMRSELGDHVWLIRFRGSLAGEAVTLSTSSGTVETVNTGGPLQNDIHLMTINAADGSFQVLGWGDQSPYIDWDAEATAVILALESMESASPAVDGNVLVTGPAGGPFLIEFVNAGAGTSYDLPTAFLTSLLGGVAATFDELVAAVAAVDEIQVVTFDEDAVGGVGKLQWSGEITASLDYDATAAEVETALKALDNIGSSDVSVYGEDGGPFTVTFAGGLGETDVPSIVGIADGLTISLSAIAVKTVQRSRGPRHWDDPLNWSLNHVPRTGERPVFDRGRIGPSFGLVQRDTFTVLVDDPLTGATETATTRLRLTKGYCDLRVGQTVKLTTTNALPTGLSTGTTYYVISVDPDLGYVTLSTTANGAAVSITSAGTGTHTIAVEVDGLLQYAKHSGEIGLPAINPDGYREYLDTHLTIGIASGGRIVIGEGEGGGSGLIRIDTGNYAVHVDALRTSGPSETDSDALEWITTADGSTLLNLDAITGVCPRIGQVGAIGNLTQHDGEVDLGPGLVFASGSVLDKTGGELRADAVTLDGVIKLRG